MKELTDEIVRLSTEFGILTEYTAFLAREGTDLTDLELVLNEANSNFERRAVNLRAGRGSIVQSMNNNYVNVQTSLNSRNSYVNDALVMESTTTVQQVNDRAFYQRGNRWIDSRAVNSADAAQRARIVEFGSEPFRALMQRMIRENRQGCLALSGEILLLVDGEPVLIKGPAGN